MKVKHILSILTLAAATVSCTDLQRFPLDQGSSETWYSTETEFEMAVADMYRPVWWNLGQEAWSDDYFYRKVAGQPIVDGQLNSKTDIKGYLKLSERYTYFYRAIVRANCIINGYQRGLDNGILKSKLDTWVAQAKFCRACHYGMLVFHWGDVVYVNNMTTIEESYTMSRTPKAEVIKHIYEDFDDAIAALPEQYTGLQQATKGAALAMKARFALWFGDYAVAADAAKQCIALADKGVYALHEDFGQLFHERNHKEFVFIIPQSAGLNIHGESAPFSSVGSYTTRLAGGSASKGPSWSLLAAFECVDGQRIDQSPLFDSHNPFKNRDPRCAETLVEFDTEFLGHIFTSHPSKTSVKVPGTTKSEKNIDMYPIGNKNASYNGIVWRKRVEPEWGVSLNYVDQPIIILRLADVYLMYAEAMIEQNKIDDSVLEAINKIRARAYKCDEAAGVPIGTAAVIGQSYPQVTTTNQADLRRIVRRERHVEFAFEQLRYYDCIRWRIAKEAFNMPNCGLHANASKAKEMGTKGIWFWGEAPTFSENEVPNFQGLIDKGWCEVHSKGAFSDRMYLWPIPAEEILINPNMNQNDGY